MGINLPTYGRNETTVTAREAEVTTADFDDGLNLGASNAPGVGINTGGKEPKVSDWTTSTQYGVARTPQQTMHIGGDGTTAGSDNHLGDHDVQVADYEAADINDTANFAVADAQAAPDAVFHTPSGAVNRGTETIEIGERAWGTVPVA